MLKYARLLVEIPLEGNFPYFIEFANEKDIIIRQEVVYEWEPVKYTHCKMFGHTTEDSRKLVTHRQEWRAKTVQGQLMISINKQKSTCSKMKRGSNLFQDILQDHKASTMAQFQIDLQLP